MKKQLISFETAKLAKELGFPILDELESRYFYNISKYAPRSPHHEVDTEKNLYRKDITCSVFDIDEEIKYHYEAPTQSLLQKWLREKHTIFICPFIVSKATFNKMLELKKLTEYEYYEFHVKVGYEENGDWIKTFTVYGKTYEEALESGLLKALKWIKKEWEKTQKKND